MFRHHECWTAENGDDREIFIFIRIRVRPRIRRTHIETVSYGHTQYLCLNPSPEFTIERLAIFPLWLLGKCTGKFFYISIKTGLYCWLQCWVIVPMLHKWPLITQKFAKIYCCADLISFLWVTMWKLEHQENVMWWSRQILELSSCNEKIQERFSAKRGLEGTGQGISEVGILCNC